MAEFIASQYVVVVNGVNLSSRVTDMKHTREREIKEWLASNPTDGLAGVRRRIPGIHDCKLAVTMKDDFAASGDNSVHNTLEALMALSTWTVTWSYITATEGATNPEYSMTATFTGFPTGGPVGEVMETQVEFMMASGVLTVDVT